VVSRGSVTDPHRRSRRGKSLYRYERASVSRAANATERCARETLTSSAKHNRYYFLELLSGLFRSSRGTGRESCGRINGGAPLLNSCRAFAVYAAASHRIRIPEEKPSARENRLFRSDDAQRNVPSELRRARYHQCYVKST